MPARLVWSCHDSGLWAVDRLHELCVCCINPVSRTYLAHHELKSMLIIILIVIIIIIKFIIYMPSVMLSRVSDALVHASGSEAVRAGCVPSLSVS